MNTPETNQPKLNRLKRGYYRNGPDYRGSSNIDFAIIRKTFGFRSIQIGNWVTQAEQQIAANLVYDALMDLATILVLPAQTISLRGTLSLAFGTGGQRRVQAHYDIRKRELSLAKNAGGGALAHEWFHAFDHYINDKLFNSPISKFASHSWLLKPADIKHPLNDLLTQFYQHIFLTADGSKANQYMQVCASIDKQLNQFYYAMPEEMAARAFEAVIQNHPIKNEFLVKGTQKSDEAQLGLFPQGQHKQAISRVCHQYFDLLGRYLTAKNG